MKLRLSVLCVLPALLALAGPASAQKQAPGLWENSMSMKMPGAKADAGMARAQERMAGMPPEKRKQIEEMMARQGINMGGGAGEPMSVKVKVCVTPEQAARDELPQRDGRCKQTGSERSGKTVRYKFACSGERQATGEGEVTFDSDKAHHGRTVVDSVVKGQPQRMEMEHSARWLAANCGEVPPRRP